MLTFFIDRSLFVLIASSRDVIKGKLAATFVHILFSAALAVVLLCLVFLLWYPGLYRAFGAGNGLIIFLCADLVLGPMLTFVVYSPNKLGLLRDMVILISVQLVVFAFGAWTIYLQRPALQVLSHQQLEIFTRDDIRSYGLSLPPNTNSESPFLNSYFMYLPESLEEIEAIKFTSEFVDLKPFSLRTDLYRSFLGGQQWGLEKLLARFAYDSPYNCYWVDVSSKHYGGKACIAGETGEIISLK